MGDIKKIRDSLYYISQKLSIGVQTEVLQYLLTNNLITILYNQ